MPFTPFLKNFSLRTSLVVPFVLQVVLTVALVGYLSFLNGYQAVSDIVAQLRIEVTERVNEKLSHFAERPFTLNQIHHNALILKQITPTQADALGRHFWTHLQPFNSVAFSYFGTEQEGQFFGASRLHDPSGAIATAIALPDTPLQYQFFQTTADGVFTDSLRIIEGYDPRQRTWYQKALLATQPVWSDIYISFSTQSMMMTAATPVYDRDQGLRGVVGADVTLSELSTFLRQLPLGEHGQIFIMERNGLLVASAADAAPHNAENQRLAAHDFSDPLIQISAQQLEHHFNDLNRIQQLHSQDLWIDGERHFLQVSPFKDGKGLDWLIVIAMAEKDFMGQIHVNTRITIGLCLLALLLAITFGILTTNWINYPIKRLSKASQNISYGHLDQHVEPSGIIELEILTNSFNSMSKQLQASFSALETRNQELQQAKDELAEAKAQLEAVLNAVPGSISWFDANGVYLGVNRHLASHCDLMPADFIGQKLGFLQTDAQFNHFIKDFLASSKTAVSEVVPLLIHEVEHYYLVVAQKYQQGTAIVTVGIDITQRKKAEAERDSLIQTLQDLNKAYERFVPQAFLSQLEKRSVIDVQLGEQVERKMTVLFSDIRDFTTLSEQMTPQENFNFINEFLGEMSPIIREYHGFIDKYIGDAIMALFPTNADEAVQASIAMLQQLNVYNATRQQRGQPPIKIGIGLNTGVLMLGTVGEQHRMEGTVIADAVNLTSRIEGLTKQYGVSLLISDYTLHQLEYVEQYQIRFIDRVTAKGKTEQVTIYEVFDGDPEPILRLKRQTLSDFEQGIECYYHAAYAEAYHYFQAVLAVYPQDLAAQLYCERCQQWIAE